MVDFDIPPDLTADALADNSDSGNHGGGNRHYEYIDLKKSDGMATIRLARPPANYLTQPLLAELLDAFAALTFDQEIRLVVLDSHEDYFSAGLSPEAMKEDNLFVAIDLFHRLCRQVIQQHAVVLSVVRRPALGAGAALALLADIVIAGEEARFGHPEVRYGHYTPFAALLYYRMLPRARAYHLFLSGEAIDARTAAAWGLVTYLQAADKVDSLVAQVARRLTSYSPGMIEFARKTANRVFYGELDDLIHDLEEFYLVQLASTADAREGITAWLERREPQWKGM